ncbi:hypothetical protein OPQ81_008719 [Rhizoctonia solani]|nr:hypothetical protein OPQ81_008719 [Rhizoctonia solani]
MTTRRSTTGCTACKRKHRKCDEGKPHCRRCTIANEPCQYEYIEHPSHLPHLIQRTKPAPRTLPKLSPPASPDNLVSFELPDTSFLAPFAYHDPLTSADFGPSDAQGNSINLDTNLTASSEFTVDSLTLSTTPLLLNSLFNQTTTSCLAQSLTQPAFGIPLSTPVQTSGARKRPERPLCFDNWKSEITEDHDPEGIQTLLCIAPTMDRNVKDNSLPFVLQCYSQWAIVSIFEPRKIAHAMREQIIEQFTSEDTRKRVILMANVMNVFAKNLKIDEAGASIVNHLAGEVRGNVRSFMATQPSSSDMLDRQASMHALDNTLEILTLQINTQSLAACIQSMEDAAPVFRRACSEPPGQPLNIANILLEPGLNLRHFVSLDVMGSLTTGRPTSFKYKVAYSAELCERMFQLQENHGLQWLHGLPDQFILILVWINSLCETSGASVDPKLVNWVETEILQVKFALDQSEDPALRIGRMVVRECWRKTVLIYLYMVLCGADASDTRVIRVVKNFMRLVKGIKPGRNTDTYLVNPMIIAGLAARKQRDRSTLRQRILSVPECSTPGTAGYDAILQLEDIWARTKNEGRAAVWSDLRVACFRIVGK